MAPHCSTLAWKIPWTAAVHGVAEGWTQLSDFTFTFHFHALRRKWQPTPGFLPGESQGFWWAAVFGVAQSWTRLKRLSSSSSRFPFRLDGENYSFYKQKLKQLGTTKPGLQEMLQ